MIADAFDHGGGAGVAYPEPLADHAANERLARRRAVQHDVASDDVLLRLEPRRAVRFQDHSAAG